MKLSIHLLFRIFRRTQIDRLELIRPERAPISHLTILRSNNETPRQGANASCNYTLADSIRVVKGTGEEVQEQKT